MNSDMTYSEVTLLKKDFSEFIRFLESFSLENDFLITQNDKDFFVFIAKRITFFKILNMTHTSYYSIRVLISDMYNLILTIITNQKRYIFLNERSIIENYMRLVLHSSLENDHITDRLFDKLKENYSEIFSHDNFSLLKSEYCTACNYIHGGKDLDSSLISYFSECIESNNILENRHKYYERLKKILQCFEQSLLYTHLSLIDTAFHRKKSLLGFLFGPKYVDQLFNLIS